MSNLIYSSAISTPEALGAATRIQACIRPIVCCLECRIRKEEGSLATEFDIETYSGQGIRHPK
jgi:hypothetical protein